MTHRIYYGLNNDKNPLLCGSCHMNHVTLVVSEDLPLAIRSSLKVKLYRLKILTLMTINFLENFQNYSLRNELTNTYECLRIYIYDISRNLTRNHLRKWINFLTPVLRNFIEILQILQRSVEVVRGRERNGSKQFVSGTRILNQSNIQTRTYKFNLVEFEFNYFTLS